VQENVTLSISFVFCWLDMSTATSCIILTQKVNDRKTRFSNRTKMEKYRAYYEQASLFHFIIWWLCQKQNVTRRKCT